MHVIFFWRETRRLCNAVGVAVAAVGAAAGATRSLRFFQKHKIFSAFLSDMDYLVSP